MDIFTQKALRRNCVWALSNLCGGTPCPDGKYAQMIIQALSVMVTSEDEEILRDCCMTLAQLSDGESMEYIQAIKSCGSLDRLIDLLNHESHYVRIPVTHTIGNILLCDDNDITFVASVMGPLMEMLESDRRTRIKVEAFLAIVRAIGSDNKLQTIHLLPILPKLMRLTQNVKGTWLGDYPLFDECIDIILSVQEPITFLLNGYSRFHCELDDNVPRDVLRIIMKFMVGSTLDLKRKAMECGIVKGLKSACNQGIYRDEFQQH